MNTRTWFCLLAAISGGGGCIDTTETDPASTEIAASATAHRGDRHHATPIRHVIVIVGENRTFDHLFATYHPHHGESVDNLRSKGIVNADGTPGPNFAFSNQFTADDSAPAAWSPSPGDKTLYKTLPPPTVPSYDAAPAFTSLADAKAAENGLADAYYPFLTTGGSGLTSGGVDTRVAGYAHLRPGPFQITGPSLSDDGYAGSPVHRFYQMWQQLDCDAAYATAANPSGCLSDLWPWVEQTIAAGSNGKPKPATFTGEGSTAMGFYNMAQGDIAYTKQLADDYAMSDNFHQAVEGGTGANHVALMTGDAIWYANGAGQPATPPANQIENPDPAPGTNNWYTQDGYSGGTYSKCADSTQPGVSAMRSYLAGVGIEPNCEDGHYYLLNNYAPGYFGDGTVNTGEFVIPPSPLRTIGDELNEHDISWGYFGDQYDHYLADNNLYDTLDNQYCDICNAFQYSSSIMSDAAVRTEHLKDTTDLYAAIEHGALPAVSFVKPSGLVDGHPASSKWDLFEGFSKKVIDMVKANHQLWDDTVIFVTADEGGGYYDSGYIQPVDFFGDGTRIPLIAVSKHARQGHISHEYTDHVSILKFIERNWNLPPVTSRSRDNLPNPVHTRGEPYVPVNGPAIGDLFDLFDFEPRH